MPRRRAPARPRALRPGSRVALVAPAGHVDAVRIEAARARCRTLGLEPVVSGARARGAEGSPYPFLAGTDDERLADLQSAFDDPSIDAVWALRGGYGTLRILDRLDLSRQREVPIPFIGFSDNTTVHVRHAELGVVSFHGPHPGAAFPPETEEAFRKVLFSDEPGGILPTRAGGIWRSSRPSADPRTPPAPRAASSCSRTSRNPPTAWTECSCSCFAPAR